MTTTLNKRSLAPLFGLIAGICMIGLTIGTWLGGVDAYLGEIAYLRYVIVVGMAAAAALVERKATGYLEFQRGLRIVFTVFVIGLAIGTLFNWLLMNFIDTHFRGLVINEIEKRRLEWIKQMKIPKEPVDTIETEEKGSNPFSLGSSVFGLAIWYLVFFIISLLMAAVMRKKPGPNAGP